jgi:hypothetical protein
MEGDPGEGIYRVMEEENALPKLGLTALTLGVRIGVDIAPDQANMVYRPNFLPGEPNGLSCSPTIQSLPWFAVPVEWGGRNKKGVLWRIETTDLGPELVAQEDSPHGKKRHISIGPSGPMTFDEYLLAIQATRTKWKRVRKDGGKA